MAGSVIFVQLLFRSDNMSRWLRFFLIANSIGLLLACSEDPKIQGQAPSPTVDSQGKKAGPAVSEELPSNIQIILMPEQPTSSDCLNAVAQGQSHRAKYQWFVNGNMVDGQTSSKLCNEYFKRDDEVTVRIENDQNGPSAGVIIGNSAPKILDGTSTENQVVRRGDITFTLSADDVDGDEVKFRYQWLINGEEDFFHVDATLPGESYIKGDRIQVKIIPYDAFDEGTAYESTVLTVPNAPPNITSQPPLQFESLEYTYQVEAADPDDTELTYSLEEAPQGMTINEAGLVTWPLTGVSAGT
jgi:hypothetical protein